MFPTADAMPPAALARAAEARGFESLFFPEHTHIPVARRSPWPGGDVLPREYLHCMDPFVALSAAATVTSTLRLGTGITLVTERDPLLMAKTAATLDVLSAGRLLLGIGAGWNGEEMANHGVAFKDRWAVVRERTLAMRRLWQDEEASFEGQHVAFEPVWSYPKPVQAGGPPILLGAASQYVFKRIAEYGDGWMPIYQTPARQARQGVLDYGGGVARTREAWAEASRTGEPSFSIFGVPGKAEIVEQLAGVGFQRFIFGLPSAGPDQVLPLLDRYAELGFSFNG